MSHNETVQPSIQSIKQMFSALIMMGCKLPPAWENMDKKAIVQVWQSALTGMSDEDLTGISACGGWVRLGTAQEERLAAHRASFRSAYRSCKARKHWVDETRALSIAFPDLQVLTGRIGNDTE